MVAAQRFAMQVRVVEARVSEEFDPAFATIVKHVSEELVALVRVECVANVERDAAGVDRQHDGIVLTWKLVK